MCDYERYVQMGGTGGTFSETRKAELLRLHEPHHSSCRRIPTACRVCDAEDCASPACLRESLASTEREIFRGRLAQHAAAATRDARSRQNGHGQR